LSFNLSRGKILAETGDYDEAMRCFNICKELHNIGTVRDELFFVADVVECINDFNKTRSRFEETSDKLGLQEWYSRVLKKPEILTEYKELLPGTIVKLVDGAGVLEDLCSHIVQGANAECGWVQEMASFQGSRCTVVRNDPKTKSYELKRVGSDKKYFFPFTAVIS
jgi:hypothetical protein